MPGVGGVGSAQGRDALIDVVRASLLGLRPPPDASAKLGGVSADSLGCLQAQPHLRGPHVSVALRSHSSGEGNSPVLLRSLSEAWKGS